MMFRNSVTTSLEWFSFSINGKNVDLAKDTYYIISLFVGQGARNLGAENVQRAPADAQLTSK